MKNIHENQRPVRASMLTNFLCVVSNAARSTVALDMRSQQATMRLFGKIHSQHMLCGNFSTTRLTDIHNKHTALHPTAFLPQTNAVCLKKAIDDEKRHSNEDIADFVVDQKECPKTSLQMIGVMDGVKDFSCPMVINLVIFDSLIGNKAMMSDGGDPYFAKL